MSFQISDRVTWVGKIDWDLKHFHGDEYSTHKGSSYNSYLIRDKKTVLMDSVWHPFAKEYKDNLQKIIDLKEIDYIVMNHAEPDHSGGLPGIMEEIPDVPIYCTANCIKSLQGHYHKNWNFVEVKTGDTLDLGDNKLVFIEAKMLHWPDSMFTYLTGENILFSNDAFGQHYASQFMFNDLVDQEELYHEALKYYANILTPFSVLVEKKINEVVALNVPVNMICPSHGIIWRKDPLSIVNKYMEWAQKYQENQITIVYDTMWNSTRRMAELIAEGIREVDPKVLVKIFNSAKEDKNDLIAEVFKSKAVLVGSSTINRRILTSTALILEMLKQLGFKNKSGAAFGSYGWSGESVKLMNEELKTAGFNVVDEGLREIWNPDDEGLERCKAYGKAFVEKL